MSVVTDNGRRYMDTDYQQLLGVLNDGSVHVHFDPYEDIDWDAPEMRVDKHDRRWVLHPELDLLGSHPWYQAQPLERQIEIGRFRMTNAIRTGAHFEMLLIRALMQYAMDLPNQNPEFRYCLHEMTEECNHIQMFQELTNHIGEDVPGAPRHLKRAIPWLSAIFGYLPIPLMVMILAGEEPIDHYQKAMMREGHELPPLMQRAMQIHIAEEARHISFASEYLRLNIPRLSRTQKRIQALLFPFAMKIGAYEIMVSPRKQMRQMGVPDEVYREAFFGERSKRIYASYFDDMRALCIETGLMGRLGTWAWKKFGIDGEPSRFRGEPDRTAIIG